MRLTFIVILLLLFAACNTENEKDSYDPSIAPPPPAPLIPYSIVNQYPHDTGAYTQGLEWFNGKLLEGTGDYENSSLRISELKTGKVEQVHKMGSRDIFGEGVTVFNGKIYQLTWQSKLVYVYDVSNISKPIKTLQWPNEGWGITHSDKELIISDGTATLHFVDPETFRINSSIAVTENSNPVYNLNELEYINGYVYANIYQKSEIIRIDPSSGHVKGRMDFVNLLQPSDRIPGRTDVLNGIAWDSAGSRMFITGKRWPKIYEIRFDAAAPAI